ncbi:MAG: M15 family metallopeptidase [Erysipelotrichaceae bacterium]|nr:M15 family metallopeptidase [Erysipelotrichaceae bacterium]
MSKRVINRWFVVILAAVLLAALSLYKIPHYQKEKALEALGYKEEEIKAIFKQKVDKEILANSYYSEYLAQEVQKDTFNKKYLGLYVVRDFVNEDTFTLYERLLKTGKYDAAELLTLFGGAHDYELMPLFVFDKVDAEAYAADCRNHPENSASSVILTNDYLEPYENTTDVKDPSAIDAFVSKKYYLGTYEPNKLVEVPQRYGVPNLFLQSEGLAAFTDLCDDLADSVEGEGIYAVGAYKSYEDQSTYYETYGLDADMYATRPGYSDSQTGLAVEVVSSANARVSLFGETASYKWMQEHAHEYGFIERYPQNKKSITGEEGNYAYWRFVGTDLATKIKESGLTFDEYYAYYINGQETNANTNTAN